MGDSWAQSNALGEGSSGLSSVGGTSEEGFIDSLPSRVAALMRAQAQGNASSKSTPTKKRKMQSKLETVAEAQDAVAVVAAAGKGGGEMSMGTAVATSTKVEVAVGTNESGSISELHSETAVATLMVTTAMGEDILSEEDQALSFATVKGDRPELEPYGFEWRSRRLKEEQHSQRSMLNAEIEPVRFAPVASSLSSSMTAITTAAQPQALVGSTDSVIATSAVSEMTAANERVVAVVDSVEGAPPQSVAAAARSPSSLSTSTPPPPVGREGYLWSLLRGQMGESTSSQGKEDEDDAMARSVSTRASTNGALDSGATTNDKDGIAISSTESRSVAASAGAALKLSKYRPK